MKESDVEKYLNDEVKKLGGITRKWTSPGHAGVPDRIVIFPGGRVWFVEVKTDKGKLSIRQQRELQTLKSYDCNVTTVYGFDEVDDFIHMIKHWEMV